jgi:two-component system cell cycle sensor histidine kinase PleC
LKDGPWVVREGSFLRSFEADATAAHLLQKEFQSVRTPRSHHSGSNNIYQTQEAEVNRRLVNIPVRRGGGIWAKRIARTMLGFSSETRGTAEFDRADPAAIGRTKRRRALLWDGGEPEPWQRDLLTLFASNQLKTAPALPILALILTIVGVRWIDGFTSLLWLGSVLVCQVLQHGLCLKYLRNDNPSIAPVEWIGMLTAAEAFAASCWSIPLFLYWQHGNELQHVFLIAILVAVIAVRIIVASNFMPVIIAGTGFLTILIVIRCLMAQTVFDAHIAAIAIVTEVFLLQLTRRLQETAREMLTYKQQREELIERLERARNVAEEARERAEEANRAKSKFLAAMSHELRTPLNAILGYSEILAQEMMGSHAVPAYKTYAGDIHHSGQHLLSLINDILDLSRIEAGRQELKEEPLSLAEMGASCLKLMEGQAKTKKLKLQIAFERSLPKLLADPRHIKQIWLNLLSNAIKFTPDGGKITLETGLEAERHYLIVADTGHGIPKDEIESLREAFIRGSNAVKRAVDGAGLGLSIVNGLIQLHGGELTITSDLGKGTAIRVAFPSARTLWPQAKASEAQTSASQRKLIALTA